MAKRIFIADNHTHEVKIVEERLKKAGYDVIATTNGKEIIRTLGVNNVPHVIVLDAGVADVDIVKICRDIKSEKRLRDIPLLLTKEMRVEERPFRELGISEFVVRPFEIAEIVQKINALASPRSVHGAARKSGFDFSKIIMIFIILACVAVLVLAVVVPIFSNK